MDFKYIDIPLLIRSGDPWQTCDRWERIFRRLRRAYVCMRAQIRRKFCLQRNYYAASKQREVTISSRRDVRLGISKYRRWVSRFCLYSVKSKRNEPFNRVDSRLSSVKRVSKLQIFEWTHLYLLQSNAWFSVGCQIPITRYQRYKRSYDVKIERNRENLNYRQARKNFKNYYPRQLVLTIERHRGNSTFSPNFRCRIQL